MKADRVNALLVNQLVAMFPSKAKCGSFERIDDVPLTMSIEAVVSGGVGVGVTGVGVGVTGVGVGVTGVGVVSPALVSVSPALVSVSPALVSVSPALVLASE